MNLAEFHIIIHHSTVKTDRKNPGRDLFSKNLSDFSQLFPREKKETVFSACASKSIVAYI